MKRFSKLGIVISIFALGTTFGCEKKQDAKTEANAKTSAKSETAADAPKVADKSAPTNVAGIAKETLLVLKFHHDS